MPEATPEHDTYVALDTPCMGCGYNLKTMAVSGNCPECGCPVDDTLSRPPMEGIAWLVWLAAFVMVANAVTIGVSEFALSMQPQWYSLGKPASACGVPLLSQLQGFTLLALSWTLFRRVGTRVAGLAGIIVFVLQMLMISRFRDPVSGYASYQPFGLLWVMSPAWACLLLLPLTENVVRQATRRRLRIAGWIGGSLAFLGAVQLLGQYLDLDFYWYLLYPEIRWNYQFDQFWLAVVVGANYYVGRVAQRAAREMRQPIHPHVRAG